MFKLRRILNNHNNAAEIEKYPVSQDSYGINGSIYIMILGELTSTVPKYTTDCTYYVACGNVDLADTDREVRCVRVTPDMVFEVFCPTRITKGAQFELVQPTAINGYDTIKQATVSSERVDGYVVDIISDSTGGTTALVRFHCIKQS
ncbi:MAG: hypothetical protein IJW38_04175 [Clostridia bacterium]|nr:hypothetical protein [Clostridia bacterium]